MQHVCTQSSQKTQVLHWLMVNIPGQGVGGRQIAPYIGSGPPPGSSDLKRLSVTTLNVSPLNPVSALQVYVLSFNFCSLHSFFSSVLFSLIFSPFVSPKYEKKTSPKK